jgi:hypothetical protein
MEKMKANIRLSVQLIRRSKGIGFLALLMLILVSQARADSLVVNGGFESTTNGAGQLGYNTNATGWTISGGYTFLYAPGTADTSNAALGQYGINPLWAPDNFGGSLPSTSSIPTYFTSPDGGNFVAQDSDFQPAPLQQTITGLNAGDTYTVGFWWAAAQQYNFAGPTTEGWNVSLGEQTQSTTVYDNPYQGFSGWMYQSFNFTADGSSDVLSFAAYGTPGGEPPFSLLDGVTMQDDSSPTPEPGSFPLLFTGMIGFLALLASRKRLIA